MFDITTLIWLIPTLPLAATLITAALGKKLLRGQSHWPAIVGIAAAAVLSVVLLVQVDHAAQASENEVKLANNKLAKSEKKKWLGYEKVIKLWTWADVKDARRGIADSEVKPSAFQINVVLRADPLTAVMLAMVTFVSLLVAVYSIGYMRSDPGYWRFFTYISLFVFSMTMLVSVSNFLLLYVFWEAVGVCSYLLIGFWFEKPEAAAAGKKAFLVNRIGDFAFAIGVFLMWTTFGTLNFHGVDGVFGENNLGGELTRYGNLTLICLLLFVGACGKSAQFPLHVWLPDAMEGPSPVSALIHAATMVTAGVYLIARCAPLFVANELTSASYVVSAIGAFTALLAAIIAMTQTDLKRVLAYSTISQLGYMFLALGTMTAAGIIAGMFHLFTHAFFKALLFLGAGSVMHAMGGVIDIRQFGGLRKRLPITHWTFLAGCLALAGFPLLAGFWSKDAILGAVYDKANGADGSQDYWLLLVMAMVAAALTAYYAFRVFFRTFYGEEKVPPEAGDHAHESPRVMIVPLMILAVFAVGAGSFLSLYPEFLARTPSLVFVKSNVVAHETSHFHWNVSILSGLVAVGGIGAAGFLYLHGTTRHDSMALTSLTTLMKRVYLYQLSFGKFFLDEIYYVIFVWPLKVLAFVSSFFDNFVVDGLVNLCGWIPRQLGSLLRPLQIGLIPFYALAMMLGLVVLLGSLLWW